MSVDDLPPVRPLPAGSGAFEQIYRQGRRRRARKLTAVLSAAVLVLGGGVAALVGLAHGHQSADTITPVVTPTPSVRPPIRPLPYADRLPTYLPPGVTLASRSADPATIYGEAVYQASYHIAGEANLAVHSYQHRDVQITLTIFDSAATHCGKQAPVPPDSGKLIRSVPACATPEWFYQFGPIPDGIAQVIHDRTAHVSVGNNGYGNETIEWHEGTVHYVMECDRLNSDHGVTGVPFAQLIKMAQSIPVDPAAPSRGPTPTPNASFDPAVLGNLLVPLQRTWAFDDQGDPVGVDVSYDAHDNQPIVDIFLIPNPVAAHSFIAGYPVGPRTSTVSVRGGLTAQIYGGINTTAAALSWRDKSYTVLIAGTAGITNAQLQTIADHLTISSSS